MATRVVHLTYDMRIGGTEMVIKSIIEGTDPDQFEMSIFCIEEPIGPWGKALQANGIALTSIARQPGFDVALIRKIRQHLRAEQIDIIHCHQYTPWVYGVLAALGLKTKVIFTEHGRFYPDSSSWKRRIINPLLNSITDAITAISNATKGALGEYEFLPEQRISTIYNGISGLNVEAAEVDSLRQQLGLADNTKVLGTVARMDPIKNHKMMLEAVAQVVAKHPNSVLLLVGDGDERENIERWVEQLELQDRVILPGYQSDPSRYMALMDIFLLSSLSEGTSMTLLEAMSLGKPCVVTNAGGNPEIIADQVNGFVTSNDDGDEFAAAITKLLADESTLQQFQQASKTRFTSRYQASSMIQQYNQLYLTLNKDNGRAC
ncbi:glycosyltransferase [Neiella sp. HB171785]|uniref:Glycosyltransferase n=1 Tax=Neiella litorisoli TaxID=2771431 RepID=A0A8J6UQ84_9GAMM|nr:glycosyltransferase [Neiella litorisoli]MBD1390542.1 glycosyltransferase [Neiella litorisoli]